MASDKKLTRRDFSKWLGFSGLAALVPTARVLGANEDIRVAALGLGGKGSQNAEIFRSIPGVRLVAICDPDREHLDQQQAKLSKAGGIPIDGYTDFRRVLDRADVDAVCIATPNHWHSLMAIYACQAGKDVYVEKPVSHTIWEGRKLVEAAEKYGRIVQGGTQNRSDTGLLAFYEWLKDEPLGKITEIRGLCYRDRTGIGKQDTPLQPPPSLDYNLWLGPAPDLPVYRPRFHYDWHWFWHTGNGDIGNQGPHEMNQIVWSLGDKVLPQRVTSFGGRFGWHDAGQTPNIQFVTFELANRIPVYFEVRNMTESPDSNVMPTYEKMRTNVLLRFDGGTFKGGRGGGWIYDAKGERLRQFKGDGGGTHQGNFIQAVRARKTSLLRSPIQENHRSDTWLHMANVSQQLGRSFTSDELRERLQGDSGAVDAQERFREQLARWQVDFTQEPWQGGATLTFDDGTERFVGPLADRANGLLHREDRQPFVVPRNV